jgi:prepilin-type N-terminal cleavage/methylation domain-containing protein
MYGPIMSFLRRQESREIKDWIPYQVRNGNTIRDGKSVGINNEQGITLVELIIVVSIVGILALALGFEFRGWMGKYKVESKTKEIYIDLMNARARAMQVNRIHCASGSGNSYRIVEDTNPVPDGDGTCTNADTVRPGFPKTSEYALNWTGSGSSITFDRGGLISPTGTIWLSTTANADYDCIEITTTRINMGKWNGTSCEIK